MTQDQIEPLRGPYAPVQNVLDVIRRVRDRGMQEAITADALGTIGIPKGNQSRTLAALRFLGFVGTDGRRTELFERVRQAPSEAYPETLAEALRQAYEPVFRIVDPAEDDETQITDAFRQYEPGAQRQKMITLFMGLCGEAEIVAPQTTRWRPTPRAPRQPRDRTSARTFDMREIAVAVSDDADLRGVMAAIQQLPRSGEWTQTERDRWLAYFTATLDYTLHVVEGNGKDEA